MNKVDTKVKTMGKNPVSSRRAFLRACGVMGLGAAAVTAMPLAAHAARLAGQRKISQTKLLMGTFVTMTVVHESETLAQEAMGRAFEEMQRLTGVFNRYDASTPVAVLNSVGRLPGAPAELVDVMDRSQRFASLSDGAFDVTVAPVVDLFAAKARQGTVLDMDAAEVAEAAELVGMDKLTMKGSSLSLDRSGMRVTLDGIAKGYIVDRASEVLASMGARNHLINAGGDIRCSGERSSGTPWTVVVEDPAKQGHYPDAIKLFNGAVATSGNYEVFYDKNKIHHHLVRPESGVSPLHKCSVSVAASSVMEADALATTVFVMDARKGMAFVDSLPGRECFVLLDNGSTLTSRGWGKA